MIENLRTLRGILRSLRIYYGNRRRHRAMDRLYRDFVRPGDLVFDIGSHVGDRIASFRRLGCRVVALEPQPALVRLLRLLYGRDRNVAIVPAAIGAAPGEISLHLNLANPTVATASTAFIAAAAGAARWRNERWSRRIRVPVTTLDALIAAHGVPAFAKIDVEGFEDEALRGLATPLPALSFEFTTIQRDVAHRCLERIGDLGRYHFNAALGESQHLEHASWLGAAKLTAWLDTLPEAANSGDIYAVLEKS
jgi:FkbM family methyltransferase